MTREEEKAYPNWIYIGPTVARIGLKTRTLVLGSELPPQLKSLVDLKPMVQTLFVPTFRVSEARANMATRGTIEQLAADEVYKFNREKIAKEKVVSTDERKL